jgi:hypothetical protein
MIRELLEDGTIRITSTLVVQVHDRDGNVLESRAPAPAEAALAAAKPRGLYEPLTRSQAAKQ